MASIEEVKAQLMAAADILGDAQAMASGAGGKIEDATGMARVAFDGSGQADLLEILGRLDALGIDTSAVVAECMSLVTALRDAVARM